MNIREILFKALGVITLGFILFPGSVAGADSATNVGPRFLVCGWGFPGIALIDEHGVESWRIPSDGRQIEAWLLDADTVLYTGSYYVREVRRDAKKPGGVVTVWDRPTDPGTETHGCQPLPITGC